jgi:hypothetical protein
MVIDEIIAREGTVLTGRLVEHGHKSDTQAMPGFKARSLSPDYSSVGHHDPSVSPLSEIYSRVAFSIYVHKNEFSFLN